MTVSAALIFLMLSVATPCPMMRDFPFSFRAHEAMPAVHTKHVCPITRSYNVT
ncbi:hypothetical protein MSKU3_0189 [Komagataeibacter oboediens]|nr:hypothetical protein MSKU3_0189 [Komagataeibacter oboediens]